MPIAARDFQKACMEQGLNWGGSGNDGNTVSQRLDKLQIALNAARSDVAALESRIEKIEAAGWLAMDEDRVKELIAEAIEAQQPPPDVDPPLDGERMLLKEDGDPFRLQETSDDPMLLTEAAT